MSAKSLRGYEGRRQACPTRGQYVQGQERLSSQTRSSPLHEADSRSLLSQWECAYLALIRPRASCTALSFRMEFRPFFRRSLERLRPRSESRPFAHQPLGAPERHWLTHSGQRSAEFNMPSAQFENPASTPSKTTISKVRHLDIRSHCPTVIGRRVLANGTAH